MSLAELAGDQASDDFRGHQARLACRHPDVCCRRRSKGRRSRGPGSADGGRRAASRASASRRWRHPASGTGRRGALASTRRTRRSPGSRRGGRRAPAVRTSPRVRPRPSPGSTRRRRSPAHWPSRIVFLPHPARPSDRSGWGCSHTPSGRRGIAGERTGRQTRADSRRRRTRCDDAVREAIASWRSATPFRTSTARPRVTNPSPPAQEVPARPTRHHSSPLRRRRDARRNRASPLASHRRAARSARLAHPFETRPRDAHRARGPPRRFGRGRRSRTSRHRRTRCRG